MWSKLFYKLNVCCSNQNYYFDWIISSSVDIIAELNSETHFYLIIIIIIIIIIHYSRVRPTVRGRTSNQLLASLPLADRAKRSSDQFRGDFGSACGIPRLSWFHRSGLLLQINSYPNSSRCWVDTSALPNSNPRPLRVRQWFCFCAKISNKFNCKYSMKYDKMQKIITNLYIL